MSKVTEVHRIYRGDKSCLVYVNGVLDKIEAPSKFEHNYPGSVIRITLGITIEKKPILNLDDLKWVPAKRMQSGEVREYTDLMIEVRQYGQGAQLLVNDIVMADTTEPSLFMKKEDREEYDQSVSEAIAQLQEEVEDRMKPKAKSSITSSLPIFISSKKE